MESRTQLATLLKKKYTKKVYIDIFNILNNEKYSSNSNGIFFNLKEISDEKIKNCIEYIESLSYNIQDHLKNLSIREDLQEEYKNSLEPLKKIQNKKTTPEPFKKYQKEETKEVVSPFVKKVYKSKVFRRLDNIMLGKKKDEKNQKRTLILEKQEESVEEDEDLFGDDNDSDTASIVKEEDIQDLEPTYVSD
jgi:hypothetical protein